MQRSEAEHLVNWLALNGHDAALVAEHWPGQPEEWHILVDTPDGQLLHLLNEKAVSAYVNKWLPTHHSPHDESKYRTTRYLYCTSCWTKYSADPNYYRDRDGILACCGRALQLHQLELKDHTAHLLAEAVDVEYLSRRHTDDYATYDPLPLTAERPTGTFAAIRPPVTPPTLRQFLGYSQPEYNAGEIGLMLYHAGYVRGADAVWQPANRALVAKQDYSKFESRDRIRVPQTSTVPFAIVKTHSYPNFYGIRFREEKAA